ncbi:unnamed protein product [Durusdinium trenchii]|uniref:Ketosynthase family 3 (KS3) domain-containing protein n=1 Tax=Durusdinium trenchii TaxID=1381693 RepID=A0ABP0JI56_9DINO
MEVGSIAEALKQNVDGITRIPSDRFDLGNLPADVPQMGGFLDSHPGYVDREAFKLNPTQVKSQDPQQFLALESAFEACNSAGFFKHKERMTEVAVFVGAMNLDSNLMWNMEACNGYTAAGNASSMINGAVSFAFDFRGASECIDTACASGLSALASAESEVQKGAEGAIAIGVNAILSWKIPFALNKARMISDRCMSFHQDGKGYGRGEGVAAVALTMSAGCSVPYAQLLNICRNNDGRSTDTITKPSPDQQLSCMKKAWQGRAAVCQAVECHGTGTPIGDPIEVQSVGRMFGQPNGSGVAIGAIKSNINHTESAAGLAGLIKAVHVVQLSGMFPHGAGFWSPKKSINLETGGKGLILSTEFQALQIQGVGVNSFGFSGTNVHAALIPPAQLEDDAGPSPFSRHVRTPIVVPISSHSPGSLRVSMDDLCKELETDFSDAKLYQVARQSAYREVRACRKAFLDQTRDALANSLKTSVDGAEEPEASTTKPKRLVLVVPGNGCQVPKMLSKTLEAFPIAEQKFQELKEALSGQDLELDALLSAEKLPESVLEQQIMLFAFSMVLSDLLQGLGLQIHAVVGHSAGELPCAYLAGALTLQDAVNLLLAKVDGNVRPDGGMAVVREMAVADVEGILKKFNQNMMVDSAKIHIAAQNSDRCCTLTGPKDSMRQLKPQFQERWMDLEKVPAAYHHPELCKPAAESFKQKFKPAQSSPPCEHTASQTFPKFFSTVEGCELELRKLGLEYWTKHTLERVRFSQAIDAILGDQGEGELLFLELKKQNGSHIMHQARQAGKNVTVLPLTGRDAGQEEVLDIMKALAKLWEQGLDVDWNKLCYASASKAPTDPLLQHLPSPGFVRAPAWIEMPLGVSTESSTQSATLSSELTESVGQSDAGGESLETRSLVESLREFSLDKNEHPILAQHMRSGRPLVPGALLLDTVLQESSWRCLEDVRFQNPCRGDQSIALRILEDGHFNIKTADGSIHYTEGFGRETDSPNPDWSHRLRDLKDCQGSRLGQWFGGTKTLPLSSIVNLLGKGGLTYGPDLKVAGDLRIKDKGPKASCLGFCEVTCHALRSGGSGGAAILDQAFQVALGLCLHRLEVYEPNLAREGALPSMLEKLVVFSQDWWRNAEKLDLIVEVKPHFCSAICASFALFAPDGSAVAEVHHVWGKLLSSSAQPIHELLWQIAPSPLPHDDVADATGADMFAFISAWESSPVTQLLEKNQLPGLSKSRMIGPEEKGKACSVALADNKEGACTILYEWTQGIDDKELESLTRQSVPRVDEGLRQAVRRFREVVKWALSRKGAQIIVITRESPQLAPSKPSKSSMPGSGMFIAMVKCLVKEEVPARGMLRVIEMADLSDASVLQLGLEIRSPRQDCSEIMIQEGRANRLELIRQPLSFDSLSLTALKRDAAYIVIGGARRHGLSALVVETLAQMGAGTVVVVGRNKEDETFSNFRKTFRNTRVLAVQCDISCVGSIPKALEQAGVRQPVRGLFHGAASFDGDKLFKGVSEEAFEATMKPKVLGSLALLATAQEAKWELDYVCYLSSVVVSLGNLGQCAYAGANGFQADLGCWQSLCSSGTCQYQVINFTVLQGVGVMHDKPELERQLEMTRGFPAINPESIRQMLQTVLCSSLPIVTVATFDRQKLPSLPLASNPVVASRFHTIMNRFQGEVAQAPSTTLTPEEHPQDAVADPKVEALPPSSKQEERKDAGKSDGTSLPRQVLEKLEKITGKKLEVQRPLVFQGVDSQLAIEIQSQLKPMGVEVSLNELQSEDALATLLGRVK